MRTIALIGDSHATAWYPAFRKAAEEHGWTLYFFGKSACPVVDVEVRRPGATATYDRCTTWRAHMLDRLETIEGLDAVVIGRWMAYGRSTVAARRVGQHPSTVGTSGGRRRTHVRPAAQVTPRVVVMEDVPWPTVDVPSCLSENRQDVERCAFSRSRRCGLDGHW